VPTALAIAIAGALGALARYGLDGLISRRAPTSFPWGTFVINVSGSFLLGIVFVAMTERFRPDPWLRSALTIGFLGAYTTFSTFTYETLGLAQQGDYLGAFYNVEGSVTLGLLATFGGILLGRAIA